jgi:hypothetical protein
MIKCIRCGKETEKDKIIEIYITVAKTNFHYCHDCYFCLYSFEAHKHLSKE